MIASNILRADLIDIIFENRNKAYGAYMHRKFYDKQVLKSLGAVTIMLAFFSYAVLNINSGVQTHTINIPDHEPGMVPVDVPVLQKIDKSKFTKPNKRESTSFVLVDSVTKKDSLIITDGPVINAIAANTGMAEPGLVSSPGGGLGEPGPVAVVGIPSVPVIDINRPLDKADIDPSFPGGIKALTKFLERHLENPAEVAEGESVSVKVKFVVGFDGELKSFEVKEDGGELFNKEVIRVLKKMPRWIPGKANNQNVSVYFTIPVKFINYQ